MVVGCLLSVITRLLTFDFRLSDFRLSTFRLSTFRLSTLRQAQGMLSTFDP